jgi:hypothetical protein
MTAHAHHHLNGFVVRLFKILNNKRNKIGWSTQKITTYALPVERDANAVTHHLPTLGVD